MSQSSSTLPSPWPARAGIAAALICIGLALLGTALNDHWSSTVGLAIAQCAIGAAAWIVARPLLALALVPVGVPFVSAAVPPALIVLYMAGMALFAKQIFAEAVPLANYLILPGMLLDGLLARRAARERDAFFQRVVDPPATDEEAV